MNEDQKKKCHLIIHSHAAACTAGNLVPLPGSGVLADLAAMVSMTMLLAAVFGESINKEMVQTMAIAALKQTIQKSTFKYAAKEGLKIIPMVGSAIAGALSLSMLESAGWILAKQLAAKHR